MKKSYEIFESRIIISWLFVVIVLVVGWLILNKDIYSYKKFSGIMYTDTVLEVVLDREDTKLLQRNKRIFIKDKNKKVEVVQVEKNILKRNKKRYNQVFLEVGKKNGKTGEIVEFTVVEKRIKVKNIFKIIWEGDNYRKS